MPASDGAYPKINGIVAALPDCDISILDDDGTETPIPLVTSIKWECHADGCPAKAWIEVQGVEVDVEAEVDDA